MFVGTKFERPYAIHGYLLDGFTSEVAQASHGINFAHQDSGCILEHNLLWQEFQVNGIWPSLPTFGI